MSRVLLWSFDDAPMMLQPPGRYARMLSALLPPGKLWRLVGESVLYKLFAACADELDRLDARAAALLEEADPRTAVELLPEHESELELDPVADADVVAATLATAALTDPAAFDANGVPRENGGTPNGVWTATLAWRSAGAGGNGKVFHIAGSDGFVTVVEVRDNQRWNVNTETWDASPGTVGVAINNDDCTVAALEAAINASSALVAVAIPDAAGAAMKVNLGSGGRRHGTLAGGADASGTVAHRQARVVAHHIARQRLRPVDFQQVLAPLLGLDVEDVQVLERTAAMAASMGDVREIYRFFVYRDPTLPGGYFLTDAQALVDSIGPSHAIGYVIESIDFLCDDSYSLCDSDLLGA
jgi:hypothetical protein